MMIIGINHVQITIPRNAEDQARQFYCGVLGLPEIAKPASLQGRGGFWVQVGVLQLHIGTEDGVDRSITKAHIAYEVADVAAWQQKLQADGVKILESVPIPGYDRFEARDPFDNRFEFIQRLNQ